MNVPTSDETSLTFSQENIDNLPPEDEDTSNSAWTEERIQRLLAEVARPAPPAVEPSPEEKALATLVHAYRLAAAVLAWFDPNLFQPISFNLFSRLRPPVEKDFDTPELHRQALLRLCGSNVSQDENGTLQVLLSAEQGRASDTLPYADDQGSAYLMLRDDVRQEMMRELGSSEAMQRALEANPERPQGLLQSTLEAALHNEIPSLSSLDTGALSCWLQTLHWLQPVASALPWLPSLAEVRMRVQRESLLEPLRFLVGENFRGRYVQLERLRSYVGVRAPESFRERGARVVRWVESITSWRNHPFLLIYGPGGMGKSTLVSRFILEHLDAEPDNSFSFVYLDFDLPSLVPQEPLTLLIEAARQMELQYAAHAASFANLRTAWQRQLAFPALSTNEVWEKIGVSDAVRSATNYAPHLDQFARLLSETGLVQVPLLLVLDTFEEAQFHSEQAVDTVLAFLEEMQARIPNLRVVLSGRIPLHTNAMQRYAPEVIELKELDAEAAQGYLQARGIQDDRLAKRIVKQVGGNPLSLKLAAAIIEEEKGIGSLNQLRPYRWLGKLSDSDIQGQLFTRILDHVHERDEDVQKLAHPGLVLRRVTPDLILKVMARPCGVAVDTVQRAEQLFDKLAREVALVTRSTDGSRVLEHRSDVRRIMLPRVRTRLPHEVAQLEERAIDYYEVRNSLEDRAEELYHRLLQDQSAKRLDERWMPGVEPYLVKSFEDLSPRAQAYLAARLGVDYGLPPEIWNQSTMDLVTWERHTEREAQEYLRSNRPQRLIDDLSVRSERTLGSPLYLLEAQARQRLEQWSELKQVVEAGIDSMMQSGNSAGLLELWLTAAYLEERLGDLPAAEDALHEAATVAERLHDEMHQLEICLGLRRLYGLRPDSDPTKTIELEQRAVPLFLELSEKSLSKQPELIRDTASALGESHPEVLRRALSLLRISVLEAEPRAAIARGIIDWQHSLVSIEENGQVQAEITFAQISPESSFASVWQQFCQHTGPTEIMQTVAAELVERVPPAEYRQTLTKIIREAILPGRHSGIAPFHAGSSPVTSLAEIRRNLQSLFQRYETMSQSRKTNSRVAEQSAICDEMRRWLRNAFPLLQELLNGSSEGERLAAILILQLYPDSIQLDWLVNQMSSSSQMLRSQAARALWSAAQNLETSHLLAVQNALQRYHSEQKDVIEVDKVENLSTQWLQNTLETLAYRLDRPQQKPPSLLPVSFKLRHTLRGHQDSITRLLWSLSGNRIFSAAQDKTVRSWNASSGRELRQFSNSLEAVNALTWSQPGPTISHSNTAGTLDVSWDFLVTGSFDGTMTVWRSTNGVPQWISKVQPHISDMASSSRTDYVAVAHQDGTIQLWGKAFNKLRYTRTLFGHSAGVNSVAWSSDGTKLVSGSYDQTLKIWDAKTGTEMRHLAGHTDSVNSVAWSPDGHTIVSASSDQTIRVWDAFTGQLLGEITDHSGPVYCVDFSHDGLFLASKAADHTTRLWHYSSRECIATLHEPDSDRWPSALAFHPSAYVLATVCEQDKVIRIWDLDARLLARYVAQKSIPLPDERAAEWPVNMTNLANGLAPEAARMLIEISHALRSQLEYRLGSEFERFTAQHQHLRELTFKHLIKPTASGSPTWRPGQAIELTGLGARLIEECHAQLQERADAATIVVKSE